MNFSGAVEVSVGSVQFQIAPHSSLLFSVSIGPFRCSRCYLQGFSSVARSLLKWFPLFIGFCLLISSVSNSRPDTGSGGGLLFRFAGSVVLQGGRGAVDKCPWPVWGTLAVFRPHWVCTAHGCLLSPSTLLRLPAALYGAGPALHGVPVFRLSTKVRTQLRLCFVSSPPEQLRPPGA